MNTCNDTHSLLAGYLFWLVGFTGSHRFYFGKPITGAIWALTGGLLLVGWLIDFFLMPRMDEQANWRFVAGHVNYTVAWFLLFCFGVFGLHRFYMGKWLTGLIYLFTLGLFTFGVLYDLFTLNDQISEINARGVGERWPERFDAAQG
ncbi:MAG: TM2 domain-containing protein [Planctomycetes bacterium]|nr:TM2 domain-containing protein [Planctomycetota bacterium]